MLSYSRKMNYVQIPLFARLGWGRERKGLQFFFQIGPQFGIFMNDKAETNFDVRQTEYNPGPIDKPNSEVMHDIRNAVSETGNQDLTLETLRLFDVYSGKGIPEGFRSLAYTLSYRSGAKTLTVEEVENVHNSVRDILKRKGYVIR